MSAVRLSARSAGGPSSPSRRPSYGGAASSPAGARPGRSWRPGPVVVAARAGGRRARGGRGVGGRRVGEEVPPALLAERRTALTRRAALRAQLRLRAGAAVAARAAGSAARAAGRREAVTAATGRRGRGRRWRHGTRHAVTAHLAPVVGTRLVSVRAGRHVGASPSPFPVVSDRISPTPRGQARLLADHFFTRTVLVDRVSSVISSASSTFVFSRTVPVAASTTSTTFASSFAVSALPEALAS